ncbi:VOC family protein [Kitasatospora sp. NPDC093806]|uniref:VOC family protein n=1 Tax=Kitasatospora sp. NPDC093806 TaxID=3155075 RepID=UPI00341A8119
MSELDGVRLVVYPARDLDAGIAAWTAALGREPLYRNADFAAFGSGGAEIGLTRLPWADHPLVFFAVADIEKAHGELTASGATALVQDADGVLTDGDGSPLAGITDVPGRRLAVLRGTDGNLIGLAQDLPVSW